MSEPRKDARTAARRRAPLCVIGCGNPYAGDDSAGVEVVRRLRAMGNCAFPLLTSFDGGVNLLEAFEQAEAILFIDAVVSGAPAGTVHLVPLPTPGITPRGLASLSTHGWSLHETIELARALGRPLPRLKLLGIEAGEFTPDLLRGGLSPAVEAAVSQVVREFPALCRAALAPEAGAARAGAGVELRTPARQE